MYFIDFQLHLLTAEVFVVIYKNFHHLVTQFLSAHISCSFSWSFWVSYVSFSLVTLTYTPDLRIPHLLFPSPGKLFPLFIHMAHFLDTYKSLLNITIFVKLSPDNLLKFAYMLSASKPLPLFLFKIFIPST